jgi:ribosome-binding factor A
MLDLEKLQKKAPVRQLRVAELIKEVVAEAISQRQVDAKVLSDNFITVSKVKVSPDLQNATILVTIFYAKGDVKIVIEKLNNLAHKFREIINRNIKLKFSPRITFRYDDTLEEVSRINKLIASVSTKED